jgi:hypothetical protein
MSCPTCRAGGRCWVRCWAICWQCGLMVVMLALFASSLVSCHSSSLSLSSVVPCSCCPFPVGHCPDIHPVSRGLQQWQRVMCVVSGTIVTTCLEHKDNQLVERNKKETYEKTYPRDQTMSIVVWAHVVCDVAPCSL